MHSIFSTYGLVGFFFRKTSGAAGAEFAIAAPMLLLSVLAMTDIGLAIGRQMTLDQSVRAGAEFAMGGVNDPSRVEDLVETAATGYGKDEPQPTKTPQSNKSSYSTLSSAQSSDQSDTGQKHGGQDVGEAGPTVEVTEVCRCPGSGVEVSCSAKCSGAEPSRFYSISASEEYNPIFIRAITLKASIQVQVQ